jgi:hypothetical protein
MKSQCAVGKNKYLELPVPAAIAWTAPSRNGINAPLNSGGPNTGGDLE